jgi:acyl carrier protein
MLTPEQYAIVTNILSDIFDIEEETITEKTTFNELRTDSLDFVQLAMKLEKTFSIQIDDEKFITLKNIKELKTYINELIN